MLVMQTSLDSKRIRKSSWHFYNSMLQGVPIAPGQIQASYGVGPSTTEQLLGTGIAGVGLYKALT